jgi:hypothetical protein
MGAWSSWSVPVAPAKGHSSCAQGVTLPTGDQLAFHLRLRFACDSF